MGSCEGEGYRDGFSDSSAAPCDENRLPLCRKFGRVDPGIDGGVNCFCEHGNGGRHLEKIEILKYKDGVADCFAS